MKKVYTTPRCYIEMFELSEHIAACGTTTVATGNAYGMPNHYSGTNCEFILNSGVAAMFLDSNVECSIPTDPENMIAGCYNTPDGTVSFFAS